MIKLKAAASTDCGKLIIGVVLYLFTSIVGSFIFHYATGGNLGSTARESFVLDLTFGFTTPLFIMTFMFCCGVVIHECSVMKEKAVEEYRKNLEKLEDKQRYLHFDGEEKEM